MRTALFKNIKAGSGLGLIVAGILFVSGSSCEQSTKAPASSNSVTSSNDAITSNPNTNPSTSPSPDPSAAPSTDPSTTPSIVPSPSPLPFADFTTMIKSAAPLPGALAPYVNVVRDVSYFPSPVCNPAPGYACTNSIMVDPQMVMDIYYPVTPSLPLKTILFVHKGGWVREVVNGVTTGGSKTNDVSGCTGDSADYTRESCQCPVASFAKKGYAVACMNYHLIDPTTATTVSDSVPPQIIDVKTAVRFLKKYSGRYGVDSNRIAVWGVASGGYLATMAGTTPPISGLNYAVDFEGAFYRDDPTITSAVNAVVDYSAFTDLSLPDNATVVRAINYFLPPHVNTQRPTTSTFIQYNPYGYIGVNSASHIPPFFIIHGEGDYVVPYESSTRLLGALTDEAYKDVGRRWTIPSTALSQAQFTCAQAALFTVGNLQPVECSSNPNTTFPVLSNNPYYYQDDGSPNALFTQVNTFLQNMLK